MMTPDEEAYGEAMRRIQGAEQTRAAQLRGFRFLKWLPPELERLSLQKLYLLYLLGCPFILWEFGTHFTFTMSPG
jgi:hypothetical protein